MTGRFDRLTESVKRLNPQSAVKRLAPELAIKRVTPEDRAVGVAVGAVLAGAVGLSVFNPMAGASAATEAAGPTVEKAAAVTNTAAEKAEPASSSTMSLAEAKAEGWKVPPRAVEASEVIDLAKEQVGIEEEGPGKMTKFHEWWTSTPRAEAAASSGGFSVDAYNGAAWCDMFVSWLSAETGVKGMGWDAYTVSHAKWFEDQGRWGQKAKPGAIVFFDWGAGSDGSIGDIDHVGIVEKDNGDGTVSTIEGNSNNAVEERVRDKGQIVGYGYPEYA
ncbi:CHAP domain-containing protein [Actinomadura sp. WAC 06369]|uniref:CHAP domain-containing protein n=1 Tax=Actinomadura sp. WAC 06369 TaxID=2203193 RepID=UPI000F77F829|nr:CHAP domain-containing protein [Actinomadura sp. WAC 06369]RSN71328.1 CHAP domain-containing protein [Actinomadura sp. WAC 06369]